VGGIIKVFYAVCTAIKEHARMGRVYKDGGKAVKEVNKDV
jgi:hypothetical protein